MKIHAAIVALAAMLGVLPAHAQFGSGIVYDPTQSAHAIEQIRQGQQIFTNSVRLADNAIATYNLAHEMSLAPQSLYQPFLSPSAYWMALNEAADTYGNTQRWTNAVNTGTGASIGYQQASVPITGRINGYGNLSTTGQQEIAAQGATVDLNNSVTSSDMQTLGTIRADSEKRQADINALISASQSSNPTQHTEMATLQRINQALILLIQEQQEANQISEAYALQQIVGQKVQQDNLKSLFVTANDYEQNFNSVTPRQTSAGTQWAFHY
ncbi:MAG: hypothetical protein ACLGXA_14020 [Acidobacteriota bacterium]